MTYFQNDICKILFGLLKANKNIMVEKGYKDILICILRQYCEITSDGKKTWQKIDLYKKHHKLSVRAVKIIDGYANKHNPSLWKELHYEHIVPISSVIKKLKDLKDNFTEQDIFNIMQDCEVIILSKEEAVVLDGNKNKHYMLDGTLIKGRGLKSCGTKAIRLEAINAKIHPKYQNNTLDNKPVRL